MSTAKTELTRALEARLGQEVELPSSQEPESLASAEVQAIGTEDLEDEEVSENEACSLSTAVGEILEGRVDKENQLGDENEVLRQDGSGEDKVSNEKGDKIDDEIDDHDDHDHRDDEKEEEDGDNDNGDAKDTTQELLIIHRTINKLHEHVSPIYTARERKDFAIEQEYGGITGTLRPGSFERIIRFLRGEDIELCRHVLSSRKDEIPKSLDPEFSLNENSVFCDIGSGTGRATMMFATLGIRASVGFDVDPMQVLSSLNGRRLVMRKGTKAAAIIRAPTCFFHADVLTLKSLGPVTHAFAFLGYTAIIQATTLLVARSPEMRVFVPVVLHLDELRKTGILDEDEDNEENARHPIVLLPRMQMPSGNSYSGMVIPMTASRRKRVIQRLSASVKKIQTSVKSLTASAQAACSSVDGRKFANDLDLALTVEDGIGKLAEWNFAALSQSGERPRRSRRSTTSRDSDETASTSSAPVRRRTTRNASAKPASKETSSVSRLSQARRTRQTTATEPVAKPAAKRASTTRKIATKKATDKAKATTSKTEKVKTSTARTKSSAASGASDAAEARRLRSARRAARQR